ncbi:MAG: FeoA family protein [bacterium]
MQKLMAMGILPRTELNLMRRTPTIVFQTGKTQFAIDAELASRIYVRRTK